MGAVESNKPGIRGNGTAGALGRACHVMAFRLVRSGRVVVTLFQQEEAGFAVLNQEHGALCINASRR